ncbi:cyclin-y [Anaeramoeba flamelloides]|uniref:Cyclin-y n=1 Tax=Anaeramoeba flamelloides TaxID=1746091 RepID=A0AAV8A509_9EUKA|nr:cyclin-y [Anaeramoeba flamelloides]
MILDKNNHCYNKKVEKNQTQPEEPLFLNKKKKYLSPQTNRKKNLRHMSFQVFQDESCFNQSEFGTITSPKLKFIVKSISFAIEDLILDNNNIDNEFILEEYEIFNEDKYPITQKKILSFLPPRREDIEYFIAAIAKTAKLRPEICIIMLVYTDRLFTQTQKNYGIPLRLTPKNWRRICLIMLLLAIKFWEESNIWNVDWKKMFPKMNIKDINQLESAALNFLNFNVTVKLSTYTKYYFELRELTIRTNKEFPLEPIEKNAKKKLKVRFFFQFFSEKEKHLN